MTHYNAHMTNTTHPAQINPPVSGYTVSVPERDARVACHSTSHVGYFLTGKRGAVYGLLRTVRDPHLMFAVNSRGNVCTLKGNGWFTDRDGVLRIAQVY